MTRLRTGCTVLLLLAGLSLPAFAEESDSKAAPRKRAEIHTELGSNYFALRDFAVALEEAKEAVNSDSDYAPAHNLLGLIFMELGDHNQAEKAFERAVSIDSSDSDVMTNYGWFLCQRGRFDDGIKHLIEALKNPLYSTPEKNWYNAGICARRKGAEEQAEEYFMKALRLRPELSPAMFFLAEIYFKRGNIGLARTYFTRFMGDITAPSAENLWLGVRIERRFGDREGESRYGSLLRRNFPESKEAVALRNGQYE